MKNCNPEMNVIEEGMWASSLVSREPETAILQRHQDRGPVIASAVSTIGPLPGGGRGGIFTGTDLWYNWGIVLGGIVSKLGFLILRSVGNF